MADLSRRALLAGTVAVTTSIGAPSLLIAATGARNKTVVISDVHIGDNSPTVWYQKIITSPTLARCSIT